MKRITFASFAALCLSMSLAAPAIAGQARTVIWRCDVPEEGLVDFVTVAEAARHGIEQANTRAGAVFANQFGESCTVA
jgi:hypothetical protein